MSLWIYQTSIFLYLLLFGFWAQAINTSDVHELAVPGEYLVQLKPGKKLPLPLKGQWRRKIGVDKNIYIVEKPQSMAQQSAVEQLAQYPEVEWVEPNYIYTIHKTANDPYFSQLWGLQNKKQPGIDISAVKAWDIQTGSKNTIIAVIDTGVLYRDPDIASNMWVNLPESQGQSGVDDDGNGIIDDVHGAAFFRGYSSGNPMDDQGHGTHVAFTIAANGNNNRGTAGVMWQAQIMAVKFLDSSGSGTLEDAILAIDYATKMGAKILSNSWGGGSFSKALYNIILKSHQKGTLFVAAAGNSAQDLDRVPSYPASYDLPNILSVAAIDSQGYLAGFSNYGAQSVHIAAPGVEILSRTLKGYESWSGTSIATPHVSGVAGLLLSQKPSLSGLDLKNLIMNSSKKLSTLQGAIRTAGLVDAGSALAQLKGEVPDKPSAWKTAKVDWSSEHPYLANQQQERILHYPQAQQIVLYFHRLELEDVYDTIEIYDQNNKKIQTLTGSLSKLYTKTIKGSKVKIVFKTDESVQKYGFDLTHAFWR